MLQERPGEEGVEQARCRGCRPDQATMEDPAWIVVFQLIPIHVSEVIDRRCEPSVGESDRFENQHPKRLPKGGIRGLLDGFANEHVADVAVLPPSAWLEHESVSRDSFQQFFARPGRLPTGDGTVICLKSSVVRHPGLVLEELPQRVGLTRALAIKFESAVLNEAQGGDGKHRLGETPPWECRPWIAAARDIPGRYPCDL